VLWIVGLLSMLVASFAFDAHLEARITSYYRKRAKAEGLARSGIEVVRMLMGKRSEIKDDQEPPPDDAWFDAARQLRRGALRGLVVKMGEGTVSIDVVPEPARRNINHLIPGPNDNTRVPSEKLAEEWARILEVGGVPGDMWDDLVDAVLDWTDNEQPPQTRQRGAEDEHYKALNPPYLARNGVMDTVEELLLVKGFSRAILFGGQLAATNEVDGEAVTVRGIADLLTTYGNANGQINVNAASPDVLLTLPGMDEIDAIAIVEEREGLGVEGGAREARPFSSVPDVFGRIQALDPAIGPYLTTEESAICRVSCIGEVGAVRRKISCVAEFAGTGKRMTMIVRRWTEDED
jgi:general secretion pathway protein K